MITEERINLAFPGDEHRHLRILLYGITWAFEAIDMEEHLVGPPFYRIIRAKDAGRNWDLFNLADLIRDSAKRMRLAAEFLDSSAKGLDEHFIKLKTRNGP